MSQGENIAAGATREKLFYGYIIAIVAFLIMVFAWGPTYTYGIFIKPLQAEFGWSRAATAAGYSFIMFFRGLFHIATGRMTDRFGPRIVVSVCAVVLGLGYLLMSQISAVWQLYLFYGVIVALGVSGDYVPLVSTVARWFTTRRGMMTALAMSGVSVGTIIMPPVVEWLISSYTWRTTFSIIGIASFVVILSSAQFLKYSPADMGLKPYGAGASGGTSYAGGVSLSFKQALGTSQLWLIVAMFLCQNFGMQAILVHIVPHLTDVGVSSIIAASVLTAIGVTSLAGRVFLGALGDRVGNRRAVVISSILLTVSLLWLPVAQELWMVYLFTVVFGAAYGAIITLGSPLAAELFGLKSHGVIFGVTAFAGTIGGAIGPAVAGYIFDVNNNYQLAFVASSVLSVIGLIISLQLKPIDNRGGGYGPAAGTGAD